MKKIAVSLIFLISFCFVNTHGLNDCFELEKQAYAQPDLSRLSQVLYDLKPAELSLCLSFVKGSNMNTKEIVDTVFEWDAEKHKKTMGVVFRSKITRLAERLKLIDYEQLIIDIDLIKNSHLTTGQIIKLLKGLEINRRG